jgi:sporulation protein YlmC with PRC-barrel domain
MRAQNILLSTAITLGLSVSAVTGAAAAAQQDGQKAQGQAQDAQNQGQQKKIDLVAWSEQDFRNGWTAEQMIDTDVYGKNGEDIGEVENLIVGANGQIQKAIVEAGGVWDIGDTHFAVPWDQVQVGQNLERVTVPVTEDNVQRYTVFGEDEGQRQKDQRAWRATELMDDYVSLKDQAGYGMVEDLLFGKDGKLTAVVVYPDVGYGDGAPYAYPFYGYDYGFDPGSDYYRLPYTENQIAELGPFDYSAFTTTPTAQDQGQEQQKTQG